MRVLVWIAMGLSEDATQRAMLRVGMQAAPGMVEKGSSANSNSKVSLCKSLFWWVRQKLFCKLATGLAVPPSLKMPFIFSPISSSNGPTLWSTSTWLKCWWGCFEILILAWRWLSYRQMKGIAPTCSEGEIHLKFHLAELDLLHHHSTLQNFSSNHERTRAQGLIWSFD